MTKRLPSDAVEIRKVYSSQDYDSFSFITGNRNINKLHLGKLRSSMMDMYIPVPIVVNEFLQIIDGQHRFMVCKEENLPLYFVMIEGLGLSDVQKINELMKIWTAEAFMDCYCDLALENQDGNMTTILNTETLNDNMDSDTTKLKQCLLTKECSVVTYQNALGMEHSK